MAAWQPGVQHEWAYRQLKRVHFLMFYCLQILVLDASWVTLLGAVGLGDGPRQNVSVSGQLLARLPKGAVGVKVVVTANRIAKTKGVILLELSILN